jgi:RNA polymerase sigma factor (sigma-70 family)
MNETMRVSAEDLIPTRYSLLSRLQNWDDQDSWKEFFDSYWRLIYAFALKSGLTDAEAQDVVQETIICVAKDIHKFKRDPSAGSFKGWLRNLTRWRIADQLRKRNPGAAGEPGESLAEQGMEEIPDPANAGLERIWEAEWKANLLEAAVERIKHQVKEEHFQIFDLCVLRQWPAERAARTLAVNITRIYLAKHRVLALVKKEVRRLEKQGRATQ